VFGRIFTQLVPKYINNRYTDIYIHIRRLSDNPETVSIQCRAVRFRTERDRRGDGEKRRRGNQLFEE
jgi:hypothetical protein